MVLSKTLLDQCDELVNSGEYEKSIILIDSKLNSELDIESKSDLLALKGKMLSMQAYSTKPGDIRITVNDPSKVSYDYQLIHQAITCFDKSIELKPDNTFAYENKALSLARRGDFDDAIKCAKAVLDINSENILPEVEVQNSNKELFSFVNGIRMCKCGGIQSPKKEKFCYWCKNSLETGEEKLAGEKIEKRKMAIMYYNELVAVYELEQLPYAQYIINNESTSEILEINKKMEIDFDILCAKREYDKLVESFEFNDIPYTQYIINNESTSKILEINKKMKIILQQKYSEKREEGLPVGTDAVYNPVNGDKSQELAQIAEARKFRTGT